MPTNPHASTYSPGLFLELQTQRSSCLPDTSLWLSPSLSLGRPKLGLVFLSLDGHLL